MSEKESNQPTENPRIETRADAYEVMHNLRGRQVITAEFAERLAEPFGVNIHDDEFDVVRPTSDHLPYMDDDDEPAVAMHDFVNLLLEQHGGEAKGSPYIGRGTSADAEMEQALPELMDRAPPEESA